MAVNAVSDLPCEIQTFALFFNDFNHSDALLIVTETAVANAVKCTLTRMAERGMSEVMAERSRRMRAAAQELAIADARRRVGTVERAVLEYGDNLTLGSFHHARLDDTCGLTAPCLLDVAIIGVDDSGLVHARREVHGSLED